MCICPCGNEADDGSPLCSRCAALQVLELPSTASPDEIKAAYHLLVKVWHPDRFQADSSLRRAAEEKLKAINSAYRELISPTTARNGPRRTKARRPRVDEPKYAASAGTAATAAPEAVSFRFKFPSFWSSLAAMSVLQRVLVLACGITAGGVTLKLIDSRLASDPATAAVYSQYRAPLADAMQAPKQRVWELVDAISRKIHPPKPIQPAPGGGQVADTSQPAVRPSANPQTVSARTTKHVAAPNGHLMPYITAGLTQDEVTAIAGAPASASADKLTYTGAEFDFKDGKVSGWKIDPTISALRVKLWPENTVDPTLDVFSFGSTKDDVLLVQGTPTMLSADKFGYGNSEILFRNNRVVSWKNDPASVPLKAVSR